SESPPCGFFGDGPRGIRSPALPSTPGTTASSRSLQSPESDHSLLGSSRGRLRYVITYPDQTVPGRSATLSTIRLRTLPKIFTKSLNEIIRLIIALPRQTLVVPRFTLGFMISKYVIFKLRSDGSFMWIEAVEYILAAKHRLEMVAAKEPGDYHLWDSSTHKFVNPFTKSA